MIDLLHYLILAAVMFALGVVGIAVNRKNFIALLMSIELMLLAVNINFVAFSWYLSDLQGQIVSLFVLGIAAAEAVVGLAIIMVFFRLERSIALDDMRKMKH